MKATSVLLSEHRVIESVLACLKAATDEVEGEGTIDAATFKEGIDFFRYFADGCHHRKEEMQLFPLLEMRGVPREGGPIGVMLEEHIIGRRHVAGMEAALGPAMAGDARARARLVEHARAYIELLEQHIAKEDSVLFVLADDVLSATDQQMLLASFDDMERKETGEHAHARLVSIAQQMCERWSIPFPATQEAGK